jgi:TolB-like protein
MSSFLSFVVEETLAGRGERLKAFTIARQVYGRDESFDPRTDTIVRVEAGRLRHRLKHYNETLGRYDPVHIVLPKGGYKPQFIWNETAEPELKAESQKPKHAPPRLPSTRTALTVGVGALLIILALVVWLFWDLEQRPTAGQSTVPGQTTDPISKPFVAVMPLETRSNDKLEGRLAAGLVEAIITNLAKLSGLSVMAHTSMLQLNNQSANISSIKREFDASHILRGSLEREDNAVRVTVQLINAETQTTIWADSLDGSIDNLLDLQDELATQIVSALSIRIELTERDRFLHRHASDPKALSLYRKALKLIMPPNDMTRVLAARRLFRRVTILDPEFAGGYAGEGFSHAITVLFLKTTEPAEELEKGIVLAKKAIKKDSSFSMGYAILAFAYTLAGNLEEGLANARQAIAVQPSDAFARFILGTNLVLSQRPDEAVSELLHALRLDPAEPRTPYMNVLGVTYYVTENYSAAAEVFERNIGRGGPTGPHNDIFRAAAYAELGRENEARTVIDEILRLNADFPVEGWLSKWLGSGDKLHRTMNNLYRLGLPKPH